MGQKSTRPEIPSPIPDMGKAVGDGGVHRESCQSSGGKTIWVFFPNGICGFKRMKIQPKL